MLFFTQCGMSEVSECILADEMTDRASAIFFQFTEAFISKNKLKIINPRARPRWRWRLNARQDKTPVSTAWHDTDNRWSPVIRLRQRKVTWNHLPPVGWSVCADNTNYKLMKYATRRRSDYGGRREIGNNVDVDNTEERHQWTPEFVDWLWLHGQKDWRTVMRSPMSTISTSPPSCIFPFASLVTMTCWSIDFPFTSLGGLRSPPATPSYFAFRRRCRPDSRTQAIDAKRLRPGWSADRHGRRHAVVIDKTVRGWRRWAA